MATATPLPTLTIAEAAERYRTGIGHAHNVVATHRTSGGPGRGRRGPEVSLNRAVVLMAVASWQAAVEDMTNATFRSLHPSPTTAQSNKLTSEVNSFSTPSSAKVRGLMERNLGVDPTVAWTWTASRGRGRGRVPVGPGEATARLDSWVLVRHAVAHGRSDLFAELPAQVAVTGASGASRLEDPRAHVSRASRAGRHASLTLTDARECLTFINRLTQATGDFLAQTAGVPSVTWTQTGGLDGVY